MTCTTTRATVVFQQIDNGNTVNQIHGFTIEYGKFILNRYYSYYYAIVSKNARHMCNVLAARKDKSLALTGERCFVSNFFF